MLIMIIATLLPIFKWMSFHLNVSIYKQVVHAAI